MIQNVIIGLSVIIDSQECNAFISIIKFSLVDYKIDFPAIYILFPIFYMWKFVCVLGRD